MEGAETSILDPITGRYRELTARQMTAIHLLTLGKSVVATAKSLEIGVSTLHRWKSKHPAFIAELNRRQHEVFERMVDKLRSTMAKAVEELWTAMQGRNARERLEIALKLLPLMQPRKWIVPTGSDDAQDVVDQQIRERRKLAGEEPTSAITEDERDAAIAEAEAAMAANGPDRGTGIPACGVSAGDRPAADTGRNACATNSNKAGSGSPCETQSGWHPDASGYPRSCPTMRARRTTVSTRSCHPLKRLL